MTRITLAQELLEQGIPKSRIAGRLNVSRRTLIRWSRAMAQRDGLQTFPDHYRQAKTRPHSKRRGDTVPKRRIRAIREQHLQSCRRKLQYFIREYGQQVGVVTIYKL